MPKINDAEYKAASVSTGGDFQRMGAGGYVCEIIAVRTKGIDYGRTVDYVAERKYVKLIFDIAEGPLVGKFSDDYWAGEDKDWGHKFYLSWKNLGALKGVCQAFDESNPGFDAYAAVNADKWGLFVGKKIGLVFGEEEYLGNDGSVRTRLGFGRAKSVQDIRDGRFKVPPLKKLDDGGEPPEMSTTADDDVPF